MKPTPPLPLPRGSADGAASALLESLPLEGGTAAAGPPPAAAAPCGAAVLRLAGLMTPIHLNARLRPRTSVIEWLRRWVSLMNTMSRRAWAASHSTYALEERVRPPVLRPARRMTYWALGAPLDVPLPLPLPLPPADPPAASDANDADDARRGYQLSTIN